MTFVITKMSCSYRSNLSRATCYFSLYRFTIIYIIRHRRLSKNFLLFVNFFFFSFRPSLSRVMMPTYLLFLRRLLEHQITITMFGHCYTYTVFTALFLSTRRIMKKKYLTLKKKSRFFFIEYIII